MGIAIIFPLKHHPLKVCDCDCIIFQQTLSYKIKNKTNWFHHHFFQYQFLSIKKLKCLCYYYCPQIYLALKTLLWRNVKQKYLSKIQLSIRITAIHVREGLHVYMSTNFLSFNVLGFFRANNIRRTVNILSIQLFSLMYKNLIPDLLLNCYKSQMTCETV